jgi:hypothetical protein
MSAYIDQSDLRKIITDEIEQSQKLRIRNLRGFAPKKFLVLKDHEKSYIAKRE